MKNLTEESAVKKLMNNKVKVENKNIIIRGNVGIGLLGVVDFLVNKLGYKTIKK